MVTQFQSASNIIARANIEPVTPPQAPPAAPGFTNPTPPATIRSYRGLEFNPPRPTSGVGASISTVSATGVQGSAPGGASSGAPASPSAGAPDFLATLSPNARMLIKFGTVAAAIYFFAKGDNVLGGVAAAAGVGAWAVL